MSMRQRILVGGAASLAVVGGSVGLFVLSGPDDAATEIQVEDTAGILYEPELRAAIEGLRFYEPTTVAVFTNRGGEEALTDDYALNDAVLDYARESRPDWLSANGQKWADNLFIFGVDPEGRLVGTYFGEDRKVDEGTQLDIQDAAKDDFRLGQWTEGSITGVETAAQEMNAPWIRTTGGGIAALVASLATVLGAGVYFGVGKRRDGKSRQARAAGDRSMADVVADYEATEMNAKLIPEGSRYGGAMLKRFDTYLAGFKELTDLGNDARAIPESRYDSAVTVKALTAYQDRAVTLDELDDVIADTALLLNMDNSWPEAWGRQVEQLRTDLAGVDSLVSSTLSESTRGLSEGQELRQFASAALTGLDELRGGLEQGTISPDDALDQVRMTRDDLSGHLDALAAAVARAYSDETSEQQLMTESMRTARSERTGSPTILSTAYPTWTWYSVASFRTGYSSGTHEVEQARSAAASASSGGSTSGFSSSGGSFSGAGSSSRF